jgi:predicted nuclease of predicted toxin-antitoxin system
MRFAVNENVSATVIRELRDRGHDVFSAKESMAGAADDLILARAQSEDRIVVTHDKDFGELAFRYGLSASCGVVLIRLAGADPAADNRQVLSVIESRGDWNGHFTVVERGRVRMRPLPGKAPPPRPK